MKLHYRVCQRQTYLTFYQPRDDDYFDAPSTDAPESCDEGGTKGCATGGRHFILSRPALQYRIRRNCQQSPCFGRLRDDNGTSTRNIMDRGGRSFYNMSSDRVDFVASTSGRDDQHNDGPREYLSRRRQRRPGCHGGASHPMQLRNRRRGQRLYETRC